MPEINRRKLLVSMSAIAAVVGIAPHTISGPVVITRRDLGLLEAVDANGNWFDAYVTNFEWNGNVVSSHVDRVLADLFGDPIRCRATEERATLECIALAERRAVSDLLIIEAA